MILNRDYKKVVEALTEEIDAGENGQLHNISLLLRAAFLDLGCCSQSALMDLNTLIHTKGVSNEVRLSSN